MLNCKQTAKLISEGLDRGLSLRQRVDLRLHLMMCGACATYRRQIELLNRIVRLRFDAPAFEASSIETTTSSATGCPEEVKLRLRQHLHERIAEDDQAYLEPDEPEDTKE